MQMINSLLYCDELRDSGGILQVCFGGNLVVLINQLFESLGRFMLSHQ